MSGKKAKAARKVARVDGPVGSGGRGFWLSWKGAAVALAAVAVVGASFVTPKLLNSETPQAASPHGAMALDEGAGLAVGAAAPSFAERDVVTGGSITSDSIQDRKTLLFFSEGVMCQACFEQIKGLERMGDVLERRGIQLVSITPDTADDLEQAISQYGITTPMIADDDHGMSRAFNTLGLGMHADTPGHAFVLVERGKVVWQRDYWLAPYETMYVEPQELLDDIPGA